MPRFRHMEADDSQVGTSSEKRPMTSVPTSTFSPTYSAEAGFHSSSEMLLNMENLEQLEHLANLDDTGNTFDGEYPLRGNFSQKALSTCSIESSTGDEDEEMKGASSGCKRGRKNMNYSEEEKRDRNRAAVKKCRQRQSAKYSKLIKRLNSLEEENLKLKQLLEEKVPLIPSIHEKIIHELHITVLQKLKNIYCNAQPRNFAELAHDIWDENAVWTCGLPCQILYGIEVIKNYCRASFRVKKNGEFLSLFSWVFSLPCGDRYSAFNIFKCALTENTYLIKWESNSRPQLSGTSVIVFGDNNRIIIQIECIDWKSWKYILSSSLLPSTRCNEEGIKSK